MRTSLLLSLFLLLSACAEIRKNILVDAEPSTPLDMRDLRSHCDLGDQAACALTRNEQGIPPAGKLAILQGAAPADSAVFSVLVPRGLSPAWFVFDRELGRLTKLLVARTYSRPASNWAVQRLEVRNLDPGRSYELLAGDSQGRLIEERRFRTLALDAPALQFAVLSGLAHTGPEQSDALLNSANAKDPLFLLWAGDNVNATGWNINKESLWERFAQARDSRAFFHAGVLRPVVAIWNELDFGRLQGDSASPLKDTAREAFQAFFPYLADNKSVFYGPGTAKALLFRGQLLALLDNRTFRSADFRPPACAGRAAHPFCRGRDPAETRRQHHFGLIQAEWLFGLIRKTGQPVWLASGDPWFGAYQPLSSFAGSHPGAFADFREKLLAALLPDRDGRQGPAVVFLSASQAAAIEKVQPFPGSAYSTWEMQVPGARAAFRGALRAFSSGQTLVAGENPAAWLWLVSRPSGNGLAIHVSALSSSGSPLFERDLLVEKTSN